MMKFESDLNTEENTRYLPYGTPDLLDIWFEETLFEEAYGEWAELIYDPDCDPPF